MRETSYHNPEFESKRKMKNILNELKDNTYEHKDRFGVEKDQTRVINREAKPVDVLYL
jgi:hypothetical protein